MLRAAGKAHPQPGCQFYPKPHLQVWTKRYKNTKVATAASNPQISVRFPSRASSGATSPTQPGLWEVWDSYSWVTTKTSYWGKGILFHVYKNVNITVFYVCVYYYLYIIIWLLYIHIYNPRIYRQCIFTSLYRLGEEQPLLLCNPRDSPSPREFHKFPFAGVHPLLHFFLVSTTFIPFPSGTDALPGAPQLAQLLWEHKVLTGCHKRLNKPKLKQSPWTNTASHCCFLLASTEWSCPEPPWTQNPPSPWKSVLH